MIAVYLAVVNIIGFALFGIDKRRAVRHAWRIPNMRVRPHHRIVTNITKL